MNKSISKYLKKAISVVVIIAMFLSIVPNFANQVHAATDVTATVKLFEHSGNGADGFYIVITPGDSLATGGWTKYTGNCVYINGELQNVPLYKVDSQVYYVGLVDANQTASTNTKVKISGTLTDGTNNVTFTSASFQYQEDGKWHSVLDETEVTLKLDSRSDTSGVDGFWFTVSPKDPLTTGGWTKYTGSCVYVNGTLQTDVPLYKATENLYYVGLVNAELSASEGTIVTIDGRIESGNDAIIFTRKSFQYQADEKWHIVLDETKVTLDLNYRSDTSGADGFWFTVSPKDPLTTGGWTKYTGSCVHVNGTLQTDVPLFKATENLYYVGLVDAKLSAEVGTIVTIDGRIERGNDAIIFTRKSFQYQADGKWHQYEQIQRVTISNHSLNTTNKSTETVQGIYFETDETDNLSYPNNWGVHFGNCVYVDGTLIEDAKVIKAGETTYYVALIDMDITPIAGTVVEISGVLSDGTNRVQFASHAFTYTQSGEWVDENTQHLVTTINSAKTKKEEIWMNGVVADKLDFNDPDNDGVGWKGYAGIVYVNDELTSAKIYKNLSNLYVIYAADLGKTVVDGLQVKVFGALTDGTNQIYYMPIIFEYSATANTWEVVRNTDTGVPGDANADGIFDAKDIVRAEYEEQMGRDSERFVSQGALYKDAFGKWNLNVDKLREIALSSEDGIPVYFDDEVMMLAAYEGPKAAGATLYNKGEAVGTVQSGQSIAEFQRYANAGFNTLIVETPTFVSVSGQGEYALMGSGGGHWERLTEYIGKAADTKLDVIVSSEALHSYLVEEQATKADGATKVDVTDTFLTRDLRQLLTGRVEDTADGSYYIAPGMLDHSNFKGILMGDELRYKHFEAYQKAHSILNQLAPSVPTFNSQFAGMNEDTGKSWAEDYGPVAGTFCYDMYPYSKDGSVKKDWLYNMQLSAKAGAEYDFTTGITLQAHGQVVSTHKNGQLVENESLGLRDIKEKDDISYQVYTSLAYGMKYLSYYTYAPHRLQFDTHYYTGTMIEYDEEQNIVETDTYRAVQAVNKDILKFDHVFLDYDWQGTIAISKENKENLFGQLEAYDTDAISSYSATHDALIGCMYDPDKKINGYWLVNAVNPQDNQANQVTVTFEGKTKVIVYNPSQGVCGEIQDLDNHTYTAELGSGEGQFVIPLS